MPVYEYLCNECYEVTEEYSARIHSEQEYGCKFCGKTALRIMSRPQAVKVDEAHYVLGADGKEVKSKYDQLEALQKDAEEIKNRAKQRGSFKMDTYREIAQSRKDKANRGMPTKEKV